MIAPLSLARGGVGPSEQLDLAPLLDGFRRDLHLVRPWRGLGRQARDMHTAARAAGRAGRGLRRDAQPVRREVGGVREPGRVAAHDADAGAAFAAGDELLGAAVVEAGARGAPVLDEHLGEVAAVAQRVFERRTQDIGFEHEIPSICMPTYGLNGPGRDPTAYRTSMGVKLGLAGSVTLLVADADTSLALHSGDVPVLGTPRVVALAEQASVEAVADELHANATTVGYQVQLTHLAPTPVGGKVTAEATLESVEGRRLTFRVSVSDSRGLVAAGRITRVVVERDRFLERAQGE